jgi:hypothetical protein
VQPACALLVFVQQVAHLVDCERRVLPVKRLLAFTLIQKRPVLRVSPGGGLFVGLRRILGIRCRLSWISASRISHCLLRRILRSGATPPVRPRIELPRREFTRSRKLFRIGFFLDVKCADARLIVYRCAVGCEFLLLIAVLQRHVRLEQAIHQLLLLVLGADAKSGSSQKHHRGCQQFSHGARLPKSGCACKANLMNALPQPYRGDGALQPPSAPIKVGPFCCVLSCRRE